MEIQNVFLSVSHFSLFNVFICSERCDVLFSHINGDLFTCEDNMLLFFTFEDIMFSSEGSPGISLAFI